MNRQTILVVDDEQSIRNALRQLLEDSGFEALTAVSGEDALQRLQKSDVAMIFLDLKLPGMDGVEVLRQLRRSGNRVPVVMMTAYGTIESAVEAMKLGAVDYLRKPLSPDQIKDLVQRALIHAEDYEVRPRGYDELIKDAKSRIDEQRPEDAMQYLQKAFYVDSSRAEAFNLLGVVFELKGDRSGAQKRYNAALALDSSYEPARKNLERTMKANYTLDGLETGLSDAKRGK